jgi:hypothetical protein
MLKYIYIPCYDYEYKYYRQELADLMAKEISSLPLGPSFFGAINTLPFLTHCLESFNMFTSMRIWNQL